MLSSKGSHSSSSAFQLWNHNSAYLIYKPPETSIWAAAFINGKCIQPIPLRIFRIFFSCEHWLMIGIFSHQQRSRDRLCTPILEHKVDLVLVLMQWWNPAESAVRHISYRAFVPKNCSQPQKWRPYFDFICPGLKLDFHTDSLAKQCQCWSVSLQSHLMLALTVSDLSPGNQEVGIYKCRSLQELTPAMYQGFSHSMKVLESPGT